MSTNTGPRETLTDKMIIDLHREAASAGDELLAAECSRALEGDLSARDTVADTVSEARGMDDSTPFIRVVA